MASLEAPQSAARRHGARLLRFPSLEPATQADFGKPRTVIFVHGFTANATYMAFMMQQFAGSNFYPLAYQYPSDRGIDYAATALRELLEAFDSNKDVSGERLVLVCHSMGGLVGRALIALEGGDEYVRKLITLGTPHDGTLKTSFVLRLYINWGEAISGLNPHAYASNSISARQLIGGDAAPTLLSKLIAARPVGRPVDYYSISGGYGKLDFGGGPIKNKLANAYLQRVLRGNNDGLVPENSSDLSGAAFHGCAPDCVHMNSYAEWGFINHSSLADHQLVTQRAVGFAR